VEALAFWPESGMPLYVPGPDDPPETVFVARRASDGARFAVRVALTRVAVKPDLFRLQFERFRRQAKEPCLTEKFCTEETGYHLALSTFCEQMLCLTN
jgi:hypothetical protein